MFKTADTRAISEVAERFPDGLTSNYIDPVLGRSLIEHLKTHWLIRLQCGYAQGYEAQKLKQYLEADKFTEIDWMAIATVCGFPRSWAIKQMEAIAL